MGIGAAIIGFFSALPDLLKLLQSFMSWFQHASGNDPQGFAKKVGAAFDQLNSAQTDKDRENAAQAIANLVSGLS